jgi:hypothetical protein
VSGATVSSSRIKNAAEECIEQARLEKTGLLDSGLYHFINNSGYGVTITLAGESPWPPILPGGRRTVLSPAVPSFSSAGMPVMVQEERRVIFYNP